MKAVRVRTVYGAVGDLFAWLCLAGMVVLAVAALRGYGASPRRTSS